MPLTPDDVDAVCGLVLDLCGVYLDQSKGYLIESRLADLVTRAGCASYAELARKARATNDRILQMRIVDAITTNETLFFRDNSPFEALRHKVLPDLIDAKAGSVFPKRIRIWSAACSTGQEPYSIAITIRELIPDVDTWNITILGTDVSDAAIQRASSGRYAAHEIERGLSPTHLNKYFLRQGKDWQVRDELRAMVSYQRLNLLQPFSSVGMFDVVLCRNVAIYFTPQARKDVFLRLAERLPAEGYLFVGASESLTDLGPRFTPQQHCRSVFYRPNLSAAERALDRRGRQ